MEKKAILITFSVESKKFSSNYERNKFFRELYGWKQIIKKEEKRYTYRRNGLLDEMPHLKVDQSMFIILEKHMQRMIEFLEDWEDKIRWNKFNVLLDQEQEKMLKGCFDE